MKGIKMFSGVVAGKAKIAEINKKNETIKKNFQNENKQQKTIRMGFRFCPFLHEYVCPGWHKRGTLAQGAF